MLRVTPGSVRRWRRAWRVLTHLVPATREHRRAGFALSEQRFPGRWGSLPATDFARYNADGLLTVGYGRLASCA